MVRSTIQQLLVPMRIRQAQTTLQIHIMLKILLHHGNRKEKALNLLLLRNTKSPILRKWRIETKDLQRGPTNRNTITLIIKKSSHPSPAEIGKNKIKLTIWKKNISHLHQFEQLLNKIVFLLKKLTNLHFIQSKSRDSTWNWPSTRKHRDRGRRKDNGKDKLVWEICRSKEYYVKLNMKLRNRNKENRNRKSRTKDKEWWSKITIFQQKGSLIHIF